jgi:hypothetical protein
VPFESGATAFFLNYRFAMSVWAERRELFILGKVHKLRARTSLRGPALFAVKFDGSRFNQLSRRAVF